MTHRMVDRMTDQMPPVVGKESKKERLARSVESHEVVARVASGTYSFHPPTPEEKASSAPPVRFTSPECTDCRVRGCPTPSKCVEILRLRALVIHYADQCGITEEEVMRVHNV